MLPGIFGLVSTGGGVDWLALAFGCCGAFGSASDARSALESVCAEAASSPAVDTLACAAATVARRYFTGLGFPSWAARPIGKSIPRTNTSRFIVWVPLRKLFHCLRLFLLSRSEEHTSEL